MPINAIVRASFQKCVKANQAVSKALVGHPQNPTGVGPFEHIGTQAFSCTGAADLDVAEALLNLGKALVEHAEKLDFVSVTVVRSK